MTSAIIWIQFLSALSWISTSLCRDKTIEESPSTMILWHNKKKSLNKCKPSLRANTPAIFASPSPEKPWISQIISPLFYFLQGFSNLKGPGLSTILNSIWATPLEMGIISPWCQPFLGNIMLLTQSCSRMEEETPLDSFAFRLIPSIHPYFKREYQEWMSG